MVKNDSEDNKNIDGGFMEEDKEGFYNWKKIGIIFSAVVIVLVYNGISLSMERAKTLGEDNINNINNTNNTTNITHNISLSNSSNFSLSNLDKVFKETVSQNYAVISSDLNCISTAAKAENFTDTARCGRFLKEDSNRIINKIKDYNTSSPIQLEIMDEFKKSLEDYNLGGMNLDIGSSNRNISQMADASMQIHNGTVKIEKVMKLLGQN